MRDVLREYERFRREGTPVGRAVVTAVWGSAPRPAGASLLVAADGRMAGSVSGGCVESAAAAAVLEVLAGGKPRVERYGVSNETAWEVGLSCGGTIALLLEPSVRREIVEAAAGRGGIVIGTVVGGGAAVGTGIVLRPEEGKADTADGLLQRLVPELLPAAGRALAAEAGTVVQAGTGEQQVEVFLEVFPRQPRLVVFGGVHIAAELVALARRMGFYTAVADGRAAFLTRERFPDADELILAWPEEAFARTGLDASTYVCLLSHDPKFDEPALRLALRSPARYIGAIGSRKTQADRRRRLQEAGFTPEEIGRIHGPIGLDLGGRGAAETALAILAEMMAVRYGASARPRSEAGTAP
jgi:xanthine dehydrogenase accessory factor